MERMTEDEATLGLLGISMGLLAIGLLLMQTGCGGVMVVGTPEGIREWGNMTNGAIAESKASPDTKGAYWQLRELKEVEQTKRETSPDFWSRLVGGAK